MPKGVKYGSQVLAGGRWTQTRKQVNQRPSYRSARKWRVRPSQLEDGWFAVEVLFIVLPCLHLGAAVPGPACLRVWVMLSVAGPRGGRELSGARNHTCLHFSQLYQLCNLSSFISTEIKSKCEQLGKWCLTYYSLRKCERLILNFIPPIKYFDHNWLLGIFLKNFEFLFIWVYIFFFLLNIFAKILFCCYLANFQFNDLFSPWCFREETSSSLFLCYSGERPGVCLLSAEPSACSSSCSSRLLSPSSLCNSYSAFSFQLKRHLLCFLNASNVLGLCWVAPLGLPYRKWYP